MSSRENDREDYCETDRGTMTPVELSVNRVMKALLEPCDRRFVALSWIDGNLYVYDGWIEYTLEGLTPRDIFGDGWKMLLALRADLDPRGCGGDRILIDFAQGTIYVGDEMVVENFLEEVVDEHYRHSPLSAVLDSAVGEKLDGNTPDSV